MAMSATTRRSNPLTESVELRHGYPGPSASRPRSLADLGADEPIAIPAIGLTLRVRMAPAVFGGAASLIETVHAAGFGPPLHRHAETETFRVLKGRYVMQLDARRFVVEAGDVITVPGGVAHAFVNVSEGESSQLVLITPGMQADVFFRELGELMRDGRPAQATLEAFGRPWGVEFLGPPLRADVLASCDMAP